VLSRANGAPADVAVHSRQVYHYVDLFSRLSPADKRRVLDEYFKFMFVRHPFERLVSAHHDKLVSAKYDAQPHVVRKTSSRLQLVVSDTFSVNLFLEMSRVTRLHLN